ncbi:MAG: DUF2341 domain-containing protein [Kiritimatiellae bacterium]|nr:DUF2341 domain-containing protein [Kiritimatiellia bacterium]
MQTLELKNEGTARGVGCGAAVGWRIRVTAAIGALALTSSAQTGLEITKLVKDGLTTVPTGQSFAYILRYRAASTVTNFHGVILDDVLPPGLEFQGLTGTVHVDSYTYTASNRLLRIRFINPLPAGSTGEIEVQVRFTPGSTLSGTIATNTATMSSSNAPPATAPPVTITALATNRATLSKTLAGGTVPLDENVTYTITLNNNQTVGSLNLTNVTLVDALPSGAVFVAASGGGMYSAGPPQMVTWTAATLSAGSSLSRTLTVRYPSGAFPLGARITNQVSATVTPLGRPPTNLTAIAVHTAALAQASSSFSKGVNQSYVYEGKPVAKNWTFTLQNTGTMPIHNVVVTDAIPREVRVTSINVGQPSGTPPGLHSPISVFYMKTGGSTWLPAPGNPYPGTSSVTIAVSSLGLGPGEDVTAIMWNFGTLPPGYSIGSLQFASTILATNRDGQPVTAGTVITNTARLSYEAPLGTATSRVAVATLPVLTQRPVAEITKSADNSTYNDGDTATFTIRLTNRSEAAEPLVNPVLADLLDPRLVYEVGSYTIVSKPAGAPDPVFETVPNHGGSGRMLLRWKWTGASAYSLPINSFIELRFRARIPSGALYGTVTNDATLAQWANSALDNANLTGTPDTFDLDSDGNKTETVYYRRATVTIRARASMDSVKWVRGELDSDWSRYPDAGMTVPGGRADYRLIVKNTGNVPIRDVQVLDILPAIGDTGVIDLSARDTQWKAALAGPVVAPTGVVVYYSREMNPARPDFVPSGPPGSMPPGWSTNPPATITDARSLLFVFTNIVIQPGQEFELSWPMRSPVGTPTDGRVAWNSFGYSGTRVDTGSKLLPSEPIKVGIWVRPDTNAVYGNRVWFDLNKNGIQDPGEVGVNGIRVRFYEDSGPGGFPDGIINTNEDRYVGFTVTADDFYGQPGYYVFPNLDRGNYYAVFEIPSAYTVSPRDQGGDDEVDSDVDAATGFTPITWLAQEETDLSWDLGLWLPPTAVKIMKTAGTAPDGGVHWFVPGTAVTYRYVVINTGELPLVRLTVTDDRLGVVGTIAGPLMPGATSVLTKVSGPLSAGVTNIGSVVGHPADPQGREIPGAPPVRSNDPAVVMPLAAIGDRVWYDVNRNGVQDAGESGVPGVTVVLYNALGAPVATNTTDASGLYLFEGLMPGDYSVGFVLPAGYAFTLRDQGGDDARDSDADTSTGRTVLTNLEAGEYDRSWDAGLWRPAAIGDRVWLDTDRDGVQDPGEPGIPGVTVTLYDGSGNVVATTTTDGSGNYLFDQLVPGDYSLGFTPPPGYAFSPRDQGGDDAKDSDADVTTGRTILTRLDPGETDRTWDAGLYLRPASLGDRVWHDLNANGVQDAGEPGVPGVTVRLYDANSNVVATTTTDANGNYLFSELTPGDYSVGFTLPPGYAFSARDQGGNDAQDSDADPSTGRTIVTTLEPGENDLTWDAGIWQPASLGDFVWFDVNQNGVQDAGEPGVPGVRVVLLQGGVPIASTVTDVNGLYRFDLLQAGTYEVEFDLSTLPAQYKPTVRGPIGGPDPTDSDADVNTGRTGPITLSWGQHDPSWDLGIVPRSADVSLTKQRQPIAEYPNKWTIPLSKGQQFVDGDYWLRLEYDQPSFDVWGPGNLKSGVNISKGWHHLAGRFRRGPNSWGPHTMEILVDGVVVATRTATGTTDPSTAPLVLGAYLGNSYWFAGLMDEVRLSRGARSDAWLRATVAQQRDPAAFVALGAEQPGSLPGYAHRRVLTVNGALVSSPLTNFPVLVSLTDPFLMTKVQRPDGADISFTLPDGTPLAHEIELFSRDSGRLVAWVRLPLLASGTPTDFVIHYGHSSPPPPAYAPSAVWDDGFMMVQHLNEASGPVRDSTTNGNHGVVSGATPTPWGITDGAFAFDGLDDKITIPDHPTLQLNSTDFTIELWVSRRAVAADYLFQLTVRNDGPDPADGVVIADPLAPAFRLVSATATRGVYAEPPGLWTIGTLGVGETATLWIAASARGCGPLTNLAEVAAQQTPDPDSTPNNRAPGEDDLASVVVPGPTGALARVQLIVRAGAAADGQILTIPAGDPVVYTYQVRNTGSAHLADIAVTDSRLGSIGTILGPLAPNASVTLTATVASVSEAVTNVGSVTARPVGPGGVELPCDTGPVSATDDAIVHIAVPPPPTPGLSVVKIAVGAADGAVLTVVNGSPVTYIYTVRNTGNVALTNIVATDDKLGAVGSVPSLPAGGSLSWTARLDSATADVTNVVAVTAQYGAQTLTARDDAVVRVTDPAPAIQVVKIALGAADGAVLSVEAGANVTYSYTVRNIGNVPLSNVTVTDDKLGTVGTVASLPVGGQAVLTKTALNVQADVVNVATATGQYGPTTVSAQDDAAVVVVAPSGADLSLRKEVVTNLVPPVQWCIPISKGEQFVDGDYWLRLEHNEPSFDVWGPGNLKSGIEITRGWHHVVGRLTRGPAAWGPHKLEILVDGVVVATRTASGTIDHSTAPLILGAYLGNSHWFGGRMDEVRISKRARSTAWLLTTWRSIARAGEFVQVGPEQPGTLPGYARQLPITVRGAQVAGTLAQFPVLVQLTNAALQVAKADGSDLVFTLPSGEVLPFEIELFDATTGRLTAWVALPLLQAGMDMPFLLQYGNPGALSLANPSAVWDGDFVLVQHFDELVGPVQDSTAFANHGTAYGASRTELGLAGPAYRFNGTSDKIVIPDSASLHLDTTSFTIEAWFNRSALEAQHTFRLTVANGGPATAPLVAVADLLPSELRYLGSTASAGAYNPSNGLWIVGSLPPGRSATLHIEVDRRVSGTVTNTAEVVSAGIADPDSTPNNGLPGEDDQASAAVPGTSSPPPSGGGGYVEPPDFKVNSIAFVPDPLTRGGTFTARVTIENAGAAGAPGRLAVWIHKPAAAVPGEVSDASVSVGVMAKGESRTIEFPGLVAPTAKGTYTFRAFIDADGAVAEKSEGNNQKTRTYGFY